MSEYGKCQEGCGCQQEAALKPVVFVPHVGVTGDEPSQLIIKHMICGDCFNRYRLSDLLSPGVMLEFAELLEAKGLEPDWNRAWLDYMLLDSVRHAQIEAAKATIQ
jgi:hypothetical protein